MKIRFRTKPVNVYDAETGELAHRAVKVPQLKRHHVDMVAARAHPKYGSYANSDMFPAMLARIRKARFPQGAFKLDEPPEGVVADYDGFFVAVSWEE